MCFFKESIKFAVLAFGVIFLLTGAALTSIGSIYEITFRDLSQAIPSSYNHLYLIPHLTIVAGALITLVTLLGCAGALFNNRCLLITYAVLLVIVFFLQVSVGIFTFVSVQNQDELSENINATIDVIFQTKDDPDFINLLQKQLHCCGTFGPSFWNETMNEPFPQTCCVDEKCVTMYSDGCQNAVFGFLMEAARVVGIAVFAFSAAEITGAVLAVCMARVVKNKPRMGYSPAIFDEEE